MVRLTGVYPKAALAMFQEQSRGRDIAAAAPGAEFNLTGVGETVRVTGSVVSDNLFSVLRARPNRQIVRAGRTPPRRGRRRRPQLPALDHAVLRRSANHRPNRHAQWNGQADRRRDAREFQLPIEERAVLDSREARPFQYGSLLGRSNTFRSSPGSGPRPLFRKPLAKSVR